MKLVKPKAEILVQESGLQGIYKQIELAGRTCYKSEDKITEDSAKTFVARMINSGHLAMLEHGTVYLCIPCNEGDEEDTYQRDFDYSKNPYSKVVEYNNLLLVTTNYRVIIENQLFNDIERYLFVWCGNDWRFSDDDELFKHFEHRTTFKLTTSIGVTRELNRHRVHSIAEQSTRYCNYTKDKFGNEVTFCIPSWIDVPEIKCGRDIFELDVPIETRIFLRGLISAENFYSELIKHNEWQPQQAREVLPLCTATEIVHTAFDSDWEHFFDLRYFEKTGKVHPNMKQLTTLMYEEYSNRKN